MKVVFRIEVKVDYMVAKVHHFILAGRVTTRIGRPHVGWKESEDILESHLIIIL